MLYRIAGTTAVASLLAPVVLAWLRVVGLL